MPDVVGVKIDGQEFTGWSSIDIHLAMDNFSTVEFTAPFEPRSQAFRAIFRPFTFKPLEVTIDGDQLFKGVLVGINPEGEANSNTVSVTAYSLPGPLADCNEPARALPLEFKNLGLRAIAEQLAKPFGINVEFRADEGAPFKKVKLNVDQQVNDFLSELARMRNLVVANTPDGKLLCWRSVDPGHPVARLKDDQPPLTKVSAAFSPQDYYSEITGFGRHRRHHRGQKYTERNPFLMNVLRPLSFTLDNTEKGDAVQAVRAKLGRMFANMAAWTADLATWRDPKGELWKPNTTLLIDAPSAMIYTETELLTRVVSLHQDEKVSSAKLQLVLPGSFSGEIPKHLPWEDVDPFSAGLGLPNS